MTRHGSVSQSALTIVEGLKTRLRIRVGSREGEHRFNAGARGREDEVYE